MTGLTASYMAGVADRADPQDDPTPLWSLNSFPGADKDEISVDSVPDEEALSLVTLSVKPGVSISD